MRPPSRHATVTAAILLLIGSAAVACGPEFPWQLIGTRTATLRSLPVDSFTFAMQRLAPRPDPRLPMVTIAQRNDQVGSEEWRTLTAAQLSQVRTMRAQGSGPAADAAGAGLAAPVRLYVAGAVAFGHHETADAERFFRQAADAAEAGPDTRRAVWASYMLGRTLGIEADAAGAVHAFVRVRELVAAGAPDPLGLAVASFGEQALLSLRASGLPMQPNLPDAAMPDDMDVAALHQAVALYGRQAAYGDDGAVDSLQQVAEALLRGTAASDAWLATASHDPLLRHLLVAYALSAADSPPTDGDVLSEQTYFGANLDPAPVSARVLDRLAPLFDGPRGPDDAAVDAGRLAALAYLRSRYDLARRFAAAAPGPLAAWVRAKLTLQDPDLAATARAYHEAVRTLAADPAAMAPEIGQRLRAEPTVIAVARGDFETALAILYPDGATYWGDVAYLAERLLTTDQLRHFVDAHVPAVSQRTGDGRGRETNPQGDYDDRIAFDPPRALRDLLARRLMRDGRLAEAAATFTSEELKRHAQSYAADLRRARSSFWRTDRARAAWDAAIVARLYGMQLLGTELIPDLHVIDGDYDNGYGPDSRPAGADVTPLEQARYDASAPSPDRRFHYRYVAVDEAVRAASLLPPRSQAYAAVLCRASLWMFQSGDPDRARRLYRQYVAHGAVVPFATDFGRTCPSPDFAAAARLRWSLPWRRALGPIHRHERPAALAGAALVLALAASAVWARRRRAGA